MVIAAFPIAKLGALLLRQVSKPIANLAKERAKSHPFFRKYVCLPPAKFYNWCEMKAKMWLAHLGTPVKMTVPSEKTNEIELGANLLGESIIFLTAALLLIAEYARQARKETAKEKLRKNEMDRCKNGINELYFEIQKHQAEIRHLTRQIHELDSRVVQKPWVPKNEKKSESDQKPEEVPKIPLIPIEEDEEENGDESNTRDKKGGGGGGGGGGSSAGGSAGGGSVLTKNPAQTETSPKEDKTTKSQSVPLEVPKSTLTSGNSIIGRTTTHYGLAEALLFIEAHFF